MRLLIVDDEPAMHQSYRQSFQPRRNASDSARLAALASELFGDNGDGGDDETVPTFELVHVSQGLAAVAEVEKSLSGERFSVAFIDVRMPPGIDGKETAHRIRALDPEVNLVIVTGYTDYSPLDISRVAGPIDKIFYIAKPFEVDEVYQTAVALSHRWQIDGELSRVRDELASKIARLEEQSIHLAANESRAIHMANHDALTDAPNRLAFLRTLNQRVQRSAKPFAMVMIDLDRFKLVNDTLGHVAGDELIRKVAALLQAAIPGDGMVARLGGDEFGLLYEADTLSAAAVSCERIVKICATSFKVFGHSIQTSASAGLVMVHPSEARDAIDVMRRADLALHDAKKTGRGNVRIFDESMDESIRFRAKIETGLVQAIARNELSLLYQPIVAREALEISGFEALVRWTSAEHGVIEPSMFIPIAEESNVIHELGDWVVETALADSRDWPGQYVSINFSPRQFRRQNFVESLLDQVRSAGVQPRRVQIEITETAIFDDGERAALTLDELRRLGFRIALDDFGTGYSSLYNIRKFALDCLKIDKSFIDGMGRELESVAIVNSITHLARSLGLGVVAEGVETEAQSQALRLAGCSHLQGYFFSKPVDRAAAATLAAARYLSPGTDADARHDFRLGLRA